jgi:LPS-assembly lipoprotein
MNSRSKINARPAAWLLAGLLSACGFRLAGGAALPPLLAHPYLSVQDSYSDFARELRHSLQAAGAHIEPAAGAASATVDISSDRVDRRVLSVSALNTPNEYELTYSVTFSVQSANKEVLPAETLSLSREYSFDETALLAKEHEEDLLRAEMARNLAGIVMRRLGSLK